MRGKAWEGAPQFTEATVALQDRSASWRGCPTGNRAVPPAPELGPVPGEEPLQLWPGGHMGDGGAVRVEQGQEHAGRVRTEPVDLLARLLG